LSFILSTQSNRTLIIWATLRSYGFEERLVQTVQVAAEQSKAAVRIGHDLGEWFRISKGTKQGEPPSRSQFIACLERMMDVI
jgi:hypothetical protein